MSTFRATTRPSDAAGEGTGLWFTGAATTFVSLYLAAGAPTPLLVLYQKHWGFPASTLTSAFAVYALGFLAALLVVGSLSDHLGRRPVLICALIIQLGSVVMFLLAPDIGWVIAARVVQGVATGAATTAFTAALVELAPPRRKRLATILGSVGMTGGLGVGSLVAGVAIEFTDHANTLTFGALAILTILGIGVVACAPETVTRRGSAWRSVVPHVSVPGSARPHFVSTASVIAAVWMLAGLSLGLAPTIIRSVFRLDSGLLNGVSGFLAPIVSAVIGVALGRFSGRQAVVIGIYASVLGAGGIMLSVVMGDVIVLFVGQALAGIGFGAAFSGALRLTIPLTAPHERAGLVAAIYLIAYVSFGLPVVLTGELTATVGLVPLVVGYGAATILLALVSLVAQYRSDGRPTRARRGRRGLFTRTSRASGARPIRAGSSGSDRW